MYPEKLVTQVNFEINQLDKLLQTYGDLLEECKQVTPDLYKSLGIFVSLIVVNCIILGRAEAFASKHSVSDSIFDALGMGVGFTLGLLLIATIREVLGAGTITLVPIPALNFDGKIRLGWLHSRPAKVFALASGALLVMGYLKAFFNWLEERQKKLVTPNNETESTEIPKKEDEK